MKELTQRDKELATDIANTILYFRENKKCLLTEEEMNTTISDEVIIRGAGDKSRVAILTRDIITAAGEWYDKEE